MVKPTRPWLVYGKSHEWGWNESVGRRFSNERAALEFAARRIDDGWYNVKVIYSPVRKVRSE